MIAHLSGTLLVKQATSVILDVSGVGYEVTIPLSTFYELEDTGSKVQLRIYTHVREDTLQLFGFKTSVERELFLKLLSVSGVGPKVAISMIGIMAPQEIVGAIRSNNLVRLTSIPGVGKKTAERIVIELRDRITELAAAETTSDVPTDSSAKPAAAVDIADDVLSALLNFGYQRAAAEKAIDSSRRETGDHSFEDLLKRSLRQLAR